MKTFLPIVLILLLTGCETESPITEVGNPTAVPVKATATALETGMSGALGALAGQGDQGGFSCTFNEAESTVLCECPAGGRFLQTFAGSLTLNGNITTLDQTFEQTYEGCGVSACGETVVLNGAITGRTTGQTDPSTGTFSATGTFTTASPCSGITANDVSIGFTLTSTFSDGTATTNGTVCADEQSFSFESLEDLECIQN